MKRSEIIRWMINNQNYGKPFSVVFTKTDGTRRTMQCVTGYNDGTLSLEGQRELESEMLEAREASPVVKVYDTEKKAYRSFRKDSILGIKLPGMSSWDLVEKDDHIPKLGEKKA